MSILSNLRRCDINKPEEYHAALYNRFLFSLAIRYGKITPNILSGLTGIVPDRIAEFLNDGILEVSEACKVVDAVKFHLDSIGLEYPKYFEHWESEKQRLLCRGT